MDPGCCMFLFVAVAVGYGAKKIYKWALDATSPSPTRLHRRTGKTRATAREPGPRYPSPQPPPARPRPPVLDEFPEDEFEPEPVEEEFHPEAEIEPEAELPPWIEPEPDPEPMPVPAVPARDEAAVLAAEIFGPHTSIPEARAIFEDVRGRRVRGRATLRSIEPFSYDFHLGSRPGRLARLDLDLPEEPVRIVLGLPELKGRRRSRLPATGTEIEFEGTLLGYEGLMRTLYLGDVEGLIEPR